MLSRRDSKPLEYPALLPMFGGMEKKPRFLDREVITMGRARGSDFCLDGNEVSALHCIIFRASDGFRVRDCGSRTGTRVNGQTVKNNLLSNGDVLQIGPFSFEVRIPKGMESQVTVDPSKVDRLKRSRSHLVHLALRLRKKLITNKPSTNGHESAVGAKSGSQHGINLGDSGHDDKRVAELKAKIKQYDLRVNQLEESEKELFEEQENLQRQKREWDAQVQAREAEFSQRKKELEDEFQARWDSLQQELQNLKAIHAAPPPVPSFSPEQLAELESVQATRVELEALAQKLKARDKELNDDYKEILRERDQLEKLRAQWEQEQLDARKQLEHQKETISSAEFTLNDQKSQLGLMIDQLKTMQEELRATAQGDSVQYQKQIAELKKELADARSAPQVSEQDLAELNELRSKLAEAESEAAALKQSLAQTSGMNDEVQTLQRELLTVQSQLQERADTLAIENDTLRKQMSEMSAGGGDSERVAQLEADNAALKALAEELQQQFNSADDESAFAQDDLIALKNENESLRILVAKLEESSAQAKAPAAPADGELREENQVLRRLLEEAEVDLQRFKSAENAPDDSSHQLDKLLNENELLHKLLNEKNAMVEELTALASEPARSTDIDVESLQQELKLVKQLLKNKDELIEELKAEAEKAPAGDPDNYEAELHRFRKELELDRGRLNQEIESLRQRNQELDEATRELEMELSRERAEMARERIRLDRMRDEVKADMERLQREQEVRGTLGAVQKLREEILQKNPNAGPPKNTTERLKTMSRLQ